MHEAFKQYAEALDPLFQRLIQMTPVTIATLPRDAPSRCIYLFSESGKHLYVGRTHRQSLRKRCSQHSNPSAQQNQAVFAFKLAREMTGRRRPSYTATDSRKMLEADSEFKAAFTQAKERVRRMELRYVEETDPLRQTLLEIYVGVVLKTPYNDFDTH